MPVLRVHHVQRHRVGVPVAQHPLQLPAAQVVVDQERRQLEDAQPGQPRHHQRFRTVDGETPGRRAAQAFAIALEIPGQQLLGRRRDVVDAFMLRQLVRVRRPAMPGQVGRRRAGDEMQDADAPRNQRRVGQRAAAHRAVDAFLDQVHRPVAAAHFHRDVGIAPVEIRQRRDDHPLPQAAGHLDPQAPAGARMGARQRVLGVADVGQDAPAMLVVGGAVGGDIDLAGGAVEQLDRQPVFQRLDEGGHRGLRHMQLLRRAREAAGVDHLHEYFHRLQLVHVRPLPFRRPVSGLFRILNSQFRLLLFIR